MQRIPPITGDVASVFLGKNDNSRILDIQHYIFIEIILVWGNSSPGNIFSL
jgi:hypothetical protein